MRKPPPPFGNQELLAALIAISICGCSGSQRIGDGAFQKRMHRPGWHVDLGWRTDVEPPGSNARQPITPTPLAFTATEKNVEPITTISRDVKNPILFVTTNKTASHESSEVSTAKTSRSAADDPPEPPTARWNPWAVPAFTAALGTVAYGIWGTSNLVLVIAVVLTLVLAAIAVKRGRMNEWSGKGFAISALILGSLAALITLIALIAGGA